MFYGRTLKYMFYFSLKTELLTRLKRYRNQKKTLAYKILLLFSFAHISRLLADFYGD